MNIQQIKVTDLKAHPDNRSVTGIDSDRVNRIVNYINQDGGSFSPEYSLTVRHIEGAGYQIISGHHRFEAAKIIGIDSLPCIVRKLTDVDALIRMVTSNDQRDNNPLDIGGAAKMACTKYAKGMTLREFAEKVGINEKSLNDLVSASDVAEYISGHKSSGQPELFQPELYKSKSSHLAEISRAPVQSWVPLALLLIDKENTVSKIKNYVKLIKQVVDSIPEFMLPTEESAKNRYIQSLCEIAIKSQAEASKRISVFNEIKRIGGTLGVIESVENLDTGEIELIEGLEYHKIQVNKVSINMLDKFIQGITDLPTTPSIEKVQFIADFIKSSTRVFDGRDFIYERVLTDEELAVKNTNDALEELNQRKRVVAGKILNGDCSEILASWQGKKIKLLLTDPPYGMAFQSNRRTASDKSILIQNDGGAEEALDIFGAALDAMSPHFADDAHLIVFCNDEFEPDFRQLIKSKGFQFKRLLVWVKPNHGTGDLTGSFAPKKELMIHAVKGRPLVSPRIPDVFIQESKEIETDHPTEKPLSILKKIILSTTDEGDMVIDPFAGTGSGLVAALELNRDCWGAELEESYFLKAQERMMGVIV
jgi:site-specific DNA-methyltransferase (adenine-specific)